MRREDVTESPTVALTVEEAEECQRWLIYYEYGGPFPNNLWERLVDAEPDEPADTAKDTAKNSGEATDAS